jgi:hypothetical protein
MSARDSEIRLCEQALQEEREILAAVAGLDVERLERAFSSRKKVDRATERGVGCLSEGDRARIRWLRERIERLEGAAK